MLHQTIVLIPKEILNKGASSGYIIYDNHMITQVRVATVVDITGRRLQLAYDDNGAEQVSTSISKWRLQSLCFCSRPMGSGATRNRL